MRPFCVDGVHLMHLPHLSLMPREHALVVSTDFRMSI